MKSLLPILAVLMFLSCNKDEECNTIRNKEEVRGNFYFYFRARYYSNSQANSITGSGLNNEYVSGKVSETVYNDYEIGDEYCFDI
ncbi:MAG: hypothetical protein P8I34_05055 [Flavobacteriaceae bacterium]|jgi:hypothetical protein|nr:hypothetical protein [Flavobacteriaceae bacterium]MDG1965987.1 hypothetical protein [Flavobacteriaceae bacterium]